MSDYNPDHAGIAEFLRSEGMQRMVASVADRIKDRAEATAPVGEPFEDKHPGRYKASFHVRVHAHGGATGDRAEAIVYNDSPDAVWVEYGHRGREPYHTLLRAAMEATWL